MMVGNQIVPLGPSIPYHGGNNTTRKTGGMILDNYEGNFTTVGTGNHGGGPTDGKYGESWLGGSRYYYGNAFSAPLVATHFYALFPGTMGKSAVAEDFLLYTANYTGTVTTPYTPTTTEFIEFFSANDALSGTAPSSFNSGIEWNFGSPGIPVGTYYYFNLAAPSVPVVMPAATNLGSGYMVEAFLNTTFTGTISPATECQNTQATVWNTEPLNPSQVDGFWWNDGNFALGSETGAFTGFYLFEYDSYASVKSYTVSRGKEQTALEANGGHSNLNLEANIGNDVLVLQKAQPVLSVDSAQVTATLNLPSYSTTDTMFRGVVVAKTTGSGPFNAKSSLNIYMENFTETAANMGVAVFDKISVVSPIPVANGWPDGLWPPASYGGDTDGYTYWCATAGAKGLVAPQNGQLVTSYVTPAAGTVPAFAVLRVGAHQPAPAAIGWTLTVNYMGIEYGTFGPSPLSPCMAFSAP